MKRTCDGCRVLESASGFGYKCGLGYQMKASNPFKHDYKPTEDCPKPKTYEQLRAAKSKGES